MLTSVVRGGDLAAGADGEDRLAGLCRRRVLGIEQGHALGLDVQGERDRGRIQATPEL